MSVTTDLRRAKESGVAVIITTETGGLHGPNGTLTVESLDRKVVTLSDGKGVVRTILIKQVAAVSLFQTPPPRKLGRR